MYLFNPEHDLCLANNDPHYVPPDAAFRIGRQHPYVLDWMQGLDPESEQDPDSIVPWGWNKVLRCNLIKQGISPEKLPSDAQLEQIRALSHRRVAAQALEFIRTQLSNYLWPDTPEFATSVEEVEALVAQDTWRCGWVLKAPWSGSGRGLRWGREALLATDRGWCRNHIASQGSVEVSPRQKVIRECAMLWRCRSQVEFVGYSLFRTKNGVYIENALLPDSAIEQTLSTMIDVKLLHEVQKCLGQFLTKTFVGNYTGFLGVDQFIYEKDGQLFLHPAVEINVRMTMGLLAHNHVLQLLKKFSFHGTFS